MDFGQAVLLGIVQGATEFFPVSSSGHLALLQSLLQLPHSLLAFDVGLHVGTLAAVLVAMRRDLAEIARDVLTFTWTRSGMRLAVWVLLGTIPAALAGLLFADAVEQALSAPDLVAALLMVTGVSLLLGRRVRGRARTLSDVGWQDAFVIGVAQAFALFPGISRSGITIVAGMSNGLSAPAAARFSFLLSIPTVAGAALLKIGELSGSSLGPGVLVGSASAAVAGYAAVRWLLRWLSDDAGGPLAHFGLYTLLLGAVWIGITVAMTG